MRHVVSTPFHPGARLDPLWGAALIGLISVMVVVPWRGPTGSGPATRPDVTLDAPASDGRGGLPLVFEENVGQSDSAVRFIMRAAGYTQFITRQEVVWRLRGANGDAAVRMRFAGGAPAAVVQGESALPGRSHYLGPASGGLPDARHFSAVKLAGVYPAIDVRLHGQQRRPEFDVIVHPGGDPRHVRLQFAGADRVELGANGELILHTSSGQLVQHAPVAYQPADAHHARTSVATRFVRLGAHEVGFQVGSYDRARTLVIDPVYEYSTYLGGTGPESVGNLAAPWQAIAVDAAGHAYVAGLTSSTDFPQTAGGLQPETGGDEDFFIVKLSAAGDAVLQATYLGGSGDEVGIAGIAVNDAGEVYLGGTSQSSDFPTTPGAYRTTRVSENGTADVVLAKLNAAGNALLYSTYVGSSGDETLYGFAVDAAGNAYIAGTTPSSATLPFPVTPGAFQDSGSQFITKLAADGSALLWSTRFGFVIGPTQIQALAIDAAGSVYVTGVTNSDALPVVNAIYPARVGSFDAFVTKLNPSGTALEYSTYLGGTGTDEGRAIAVDASGSAYVAGSTSVGVGVTNDFPTTPGSWRSVPTAQYRGFVTKLSPAGNEIVYSTYFSQTSRSSTNPIALDAGNRLYLADDGSTPTDLRIGEAPESCLASTGSPSILRLSADGSTVDYGMRIGGPSVFVGGSEISFQPINDIAVDGASNVYLVGSTNSADFPTYRAYQPARAGASDDAYVAKLSDAAVQPMPGLQFASATFTASETDESAAVTVTREGRAAGPVRIRASTTSGGTATAGTDFTSVDVVLEWRDGDLTPRTFQVPLATDDVADDGETVHLALSAANGCLGVPGTQATAVLTIQEATTPPSDPPAGDPETPPTEDPETPPTGGPETPPANEPESPPANDPGSPPASSSGGGGLFGVPGVLALLLLSARRLRSGAAARASASRSAAQGRLSTRRMG